MLLNHTSFYRTVFFMSLDRTLFYWIIYIILLDHILHVIGSDFVSLQHIILSGSHIRVIGSKFMSLDRSPFDRTIHVMLLDRTSCHWIRNVKTRKTFWKAFWKHSGDSGKQIFFNQPLARWNDVSDPMTWSSIQWHDVYDPIEWATMQWHEFRFNNTNVASEQNDVLQW